MNYPDIIVVGAGHAGLEAALAAARIGAKVLVVTINADAIAHMPCNPAMGGMGKSQVIAETYALGGVSGLVAEESATSIRLLGTSKGAAVQSVRVQADRHMYSLIASRYLENYENITITQGRVDRLNVSGRKVESVSLEDGREFRCQSVVLTCGTYLGGRVHLAHVSKPGGRMGQPSADNLSTQLAELGLTIRRFNTGTTPRIDFRSLKLDELRIQHGDYFKLGLVSEPRMFHNQLPSYVGQTNAKTQEITKKYVHLAPSVQGRMVRVGPRTCPSLEEKVRWFPDRTDHTFFIEPESRYTNEMYLQGLYMSIPPVHQMEVLKTLPGMSEVKLVRPGYAIDYDFIDPLTVDRTLKSKVIDNLYLAGQIIGTTGYDEASALGLVAGANAALSISSDKELSLRRHDGYIGVMIDDLTTKGVNEPYRITPSHVETRMSHRADNAIFRLFDLAGSLGLLDSDRRVEFQKVISDKEKCKQSIESMSFYPKKDFNRYLNSIGLGDIDSPTPLSVLSRRPEFTYEHLLCFLPGLEHLSERAVKSHMVDIKYESYLIREAARIHDIERWERLKLAEDIDYSSIRTLSKPAKERLSAVRPKTLGQAMRVDGVKYSDIEVLSQYVSRETSANDCE
ncbi:MAG TPA: tRNA uridine-5-carboxymethylaminomethyl(34) synthesis enzyme MnmG [Caldisericia bacterium]|nr:tRNA uridine-5-carboxymethylaminomethyl(34) synthesis enzyme MnmG [Caldisericia bacterium]HPF48793.1 tRNA uridine-5-carboxymethylaminomethyl(34) synthesis enzyme MnmG [Caldisericia bacterium]HPI84283.1 tRNA uridine-5-carboxymethylaminomethyl(34) synthesis enzyme MnmG [Caldisericia bacterium]HPQ93461.1 tRNA uridine-5-carboxymethylaminomethyl(34) synthesis enzyme MnmG [Caldisericia bacterium]HRV74919.1 tRNA uridine-5-carboxymethylaminomethyl(34) synthesis enzyme MnmG [Caldisericia bacterium]